MSDSKHVRINVSGIEKYRATINRGLAGGGSSNPIRKAFRQMAVVYRSFLQLHFDRSSKGGGDWPSLAESTRKRRRKARKGAKGGRRFSILRNTGLLFNVLCPVFVQRPGAIEQDISNGIRIGFGGPGRHPDGQATIADIAYFHDRGKGILPQREIIVGPDAATLDRMTGILEDACQTVADQTHI